MSAGSLNNGVLSLSKLFVGGASITPSTTGGIQSLTGDTGGATTGNALDINATITQNTGTATASFATSANAISLAINVPPGSASLSGAMVGDITGGTGAGAPFSITGLGGVQIMNSPNTFGTTLNTQATASYTVSLPTALPSDDGQLLSATTAGLCSWVAPGTATLAGAMTGDINGATGVYAITALKGLSICNETDTQFKTEFGSKASADYKLFFPPTQGSAGQVLSTDGTDSLSWVAPGTASLSGAMVGNITGGTAPYAITGLANVQVMNSANTFGTTLDTQATASYTVSLPTALPSADGQLLSATTAGLCSWVAPGAPTLAGAMTGAITGGTGTGAPFAITGLANVQVMNSANTFGTTLDTQASANYTLSLPATGGASGQFLSTDGTGVCSWGTPATGGGVFGIAWGLILPSGSNPKVPYNSPSITTWNNGITYPLNALVFDDATPPASYISLTAGNIGNDPQEAGSTFWSEIAFSAWTGGANAWTLAVDYDDLRGSLYGGTLPATVYLNSIFQVFQVPYNISATPSYAGQLVPPYTKATGGTGNWSFGATGTVAPASTATGIVGVGWVLLANGTAT